MGKIHVVAVEIKPLLKHLYPPPPQERDRLQFSLNSRYWEHPRDCGLVSVITRVRNSGVGEKIRDIRSITLIYIA